MEWQVLLILALLIPVILFPAAFIWYLNAGGVYAALVKRRPALSATFSKAFRTTIALIIPVAIYAWAVWASLGTWGWQVALAVGIVMPIILLIPVLVWAIVASGLHIVMRDALRRRSLASRSRAEREAREAVPAKIG